MLLRRMQQRCLVQLGLLVVHWAAVIHGIAKHDYKVAIYTSMLCDHMLTYDPGTITLNSNKRERCKPRALKTLLWSFSAINDIYGVLQGGKI